MVRKYSVAVAGSAFSGRTLRWVAPRVSVISVSGLGSPINAGNWRWRGAISLGLAAWALAGCAPPPTPHVSYSHGHEHFSQSKYGHASRKVVADGQAVPHGGGQYLVGRPYTVAGRRYYPAENPSYTAGG